MNPAFRSVFKLKRRVFGLPVLAAAVFLTGCRSTLVSYPSQVRPALEKLQANKPVAVDTLFRRQVNGTDSVLYLMERGRITQIQDQRENSLGDFAAAMEIIRRQDEDAVVTLRGAGAQIGAVMLNDNFIPYEPAGYERVMLHHFQACNFLASGNLEGAGIEVRRGNFEQNQALEKHNKEVQKAKNKADEEKIDTSAAMTKVNDAYAGMDEIAGRVKDSFQNAYTFYFSGVVYELLGEANDAYIDYKKALEIMPGNSFLQRDAMRLAKALGMREDLDAFRERFAKTASLLEQEEQAKDNTGTVIVLFEDGFVPPKRQIKIPIPLLGMNTFTTIAFPYYSHDDFPPLAPLLVSCEGRQLARTELVCELQAMAVKALKEQVLAMVTRQVVRATAKAAATKAAYDQMGTGAAVAAGILTFVTENADRRSWLTLPGNAQIARMQLDEGTHVLSFGRNGPLPPTTATVDVKKGSTSIVLLTLTGTTMYKKQMNFTP